MRKFPSYSSAYFEEYFYLSKIYYKETILGQFLPPLHESFYRSLVFSCGEINTAKTFSLKARK